MSAEHFSPHPHSESRKQAVLKYFDPRYWKARRNNMLKEYDEGTSLLNYGRQLLRSNDSKALQKYLEASKPYWNDIIARLSAQEPQDERKERPLSDDSLSHTP